MGFSVLCGCRRCGVPGQLRRRDLSGFRLSKICAGRRAQACLIESVTTRSSREASFARGGYSAPPARQHRRGGARAETDAPVPHLCSPGLLLPPGVSRMRSPAIATPCGLLLSTAHQHRHVPGPLPRRPASGSWGSGGAASGAWGAGVVMLAEKKAKVKVKSGRVADNKEARFQYEVLPTPSSSSLLSLQVLEGP